MGGQSAERDISLRTGVAVHRSLVRRGYNAVAIDVGPTFSQNLYDQKIALAFLALHGPGGEDGAIQGFLETLGIPYSGSGIQASAIGMHKVTTKTLLASARISVPEGTVVKREIALAGCGEARLARIHDWGHHRTEAGAMA
jgi:D-alanine-D-alanine ligase